VTVTPCPKCTGYFVDGKHRPEGRHLQEGEFSLDVMDALIEHQTVDHLEALMHETKRAAERRMRDEFQQRWGSFWKCALCGGTRESIYESRTCTCVFVDYYDRASTAIRSGYSPPSSDAR